MAENKDDEMGESGCNPPKIICFFAHKGGVSKTTNIYHLAWMLVKEFHVNVIVADGDPQCNLTHALEPQARVDPNWRDDVERGNIFSAVRDLHDGIRDGSKSQLDPVACREILRCTEDDPTNDHSLFLLPGSLELSSLESQLTLAHSPGNFPILLNLPGAFRNLFISTAEYYQAEYVIVDMGPSIAALNQNLFMSSDYFVIPCAADAYSRSTITTMNRLLPRWNALRANLAEVTKDCAFPVKQEPTKFLGIIMSLFNVAGKYRTPVKQDQAFMDLVQQTVAFGLLPTLEEEGMNGVSDPSQVALGKVPNFLQLMQISQRANYPVYCIPPSEMKTLNKEGEEVLMSRTEQERNLERGTRYQEIYYDMGKRFLDALQSQ